MMPEAARESTTLRAMPSHSCSFSSTSCTGVFTRVMKVTMLVWKSEEGYIKSCVRNQAECDSLSRINR